MSHRLTALKVKRSVLANESRYIRTQELKWKLKARKARDRQNAAYHEISEGIRNSLFSHRKNIVRPEARMAHIANGYLRGLPYFAIEQKAWVKNFNHYTPDAFWNKLAEMVYRFSDKTRTQLQIKADLFAWRNEHPGYENYRNWKNGGEGVISTRTYGDVWFYIS